MVVHSRNQVAACIIPALASFVTFSAMAADFDNPKKEKGANPTGLLCSRQIMTVKFTGEKSRVEKCEQNNCDPIQFILPFDMLQKSSYAYIYSQKGDFPDGHFIKTIEVNRVSREFKEEGIMVGKDNFSMYTKYTGSCVLHYAKPQF